MKKLLSTILIACAILFAACSKKEKAASAPLVEVYSFTGTDNEFAASVVSEKNADGTESYFFAFNKYRVICNSKEEAIEHFNDFKTTYETLKNGSEDDEMDRSGLFVMQELEQLELHTVNQILYVDLDAAPNFAETD